MVIPLWAYGVGGAVLLATGFGGGWTVRAWKADADMAKVERELQKAVDEQRARADAAAATFELSRDTVDRQARDTRTIIERTFHESPPPADCVAPAAVTGSLREAVEGANRAASGIVAPAVP